MSQVPKPSSAVGPRPAGVPSSAQHRAGPAPIFPQTPRSTGTNQSSPAPGALRKPGNAGSIHFTEDTENFIVGDRVWVSGIKGGKIQFIGETKFAAGEWAGVVLDDAGTGKNDGSVANVQYFQCDPNRGVFVRLHKLSRVPLSQQEIDAVKMQQQGMSAATSVGSISYAVENEFKSPPGGAMQEIGGVRVGQRVWLSGDRTGIVRFLGKPHFKEGIWAGIELDEPNGKNDGSVDNQRYFHCQTNHGVFAPIAKVSKAPLPPSEEPRTPNRTSTMKRSPSQESLHSNFSVQSVQSTASRRSSAMRIGVSSLGSGNPLSPSTVAVGRTGTGTPAEIQKAHQEKDVLIFNITRERDLLKKELSAKSEQEFHVHSVHEEIQKLQGQYVQALSAQDVRIKELEDSIKLIKEEKEKLRETLEDETKKVEDLQFRLEEEQTEKETASENEGVSKVVEEKNKEIASLRSDMEAVRVEVARLQSALASREEEVEKWRQAADGTNYKNSEIADERDRKAFEAADLTRQLRDVTEKQRSQLTAVQNDLQQKTAAESVSKKELETFQQELLQLRQENEQLKVQVSQSSGQSEAAVSELQRENVEFKSRLEETKEILSKTKKENEILRSQNDSFQFSIAERIRPLSIIFQEFAGLPGPQSLEEEIPALNQLLAAVQLRASKSVEQVRLELEDARKAQAQAEAAAAKISEDVRLEREAKEKEDSGLFNKTETLKREVDSLLYQLTEVKIEYSELKILHENLLQQSESVQSDAAVLHNDKLAQLTVKHQSELEALRLDSESRTVSLESQLKELSSRLEGAESEKAELNEEIGKAKDVELKDARGHIERTFAREEVEKSQLTAQLNDQTVKLERLENELRSLTTAYAERSQELAIVKEGVANREREVQDVMKQREESRQRCRALEMEAEESKTAFAEQTLSMNVRREEQLLQTATERDTFNETVRELRERVASLSASTAAEVDSLQHQLEIRLREANIQLSLRSSELNDVKGEMEVKTRERAELEAQTFELRQSCAALTENVQKFRQMAEEKDRVAGDLQAQLEESRLSLTKTQQDFEESKSAFAEQMTLAQMRLDDVLKTAHSERSEFLSAHSTALDDAQRQLMSVKSELEKTKDEVTALVRGRDEVEERLKAVVQERDTLSKEKAGLEARGRAELEAQTLEFRQSCAALTEDVQKFKRMAEEKDQIAGNFQSQLEESRLSLTKTQQDFEESKLAFAEQMTLAQMRLDDVLKTADSERSQFNAQIKDLEDQVAALMTNSAVTLDAVRSDIQLRLTAALNESQTKSTELRHLSEELQTVKQNSQAAKEALQQEVRQLSERLSDSDRQTQTLFEEIEELRQRNGLLEKSSDNSLTKVSQMSERVSELEAQLFDSVRQTQTLSEETQTLRQNNQAAKEALQQEVRQLSERLSDSVKQTQILSEEIQTLRQMSERVSELEGQLSDSVRQTQTLAEEIEALRQRNGRLEVSLGDAKNLEDVVKRMREQLEEMSKERDLLKREVEVKKTDTQKMQADTQQMQKEMEELRRSQTALVQQKSTVVPSDDKGALDALLTKELERVKSEVDIHRRMIEEKDGEISEMKQQTRRLIEQKEEELSVLRERTTQNNTKVTPPAVTSTGGDFQVQILNSIIAEQQNKIIDLERKLKENAVKLPLPSTKSDDTSEPKLPPARRLIRLHCVTCQQFDLHDTLACPKVKNGVGSSPERERKVKLPPRPRRKFCDECDKFDQHDTVDCPVLLKNKK